MATPLMNLGINTSQDAAGHSCSRGPPHQPSGAAQMGWRWGLQQALFQGAVAQDRGFVFFFHMRKKISFPYQTRMTIYRKLCSEFIIWSERKWYSIVIHPN